MGCRELRIKAHDLFLESGLTQNELVNLSGVPKTTIKRAFYGDSNPTLDNLLKILHALGCDLVVKKKGGK